MSFDWNWFFSSFCQSAAALIGIIAAFVISRLIGLNEKIGNVISIFDSLKIEHTKIKGNLAHRRFHWYNHTNVVYDDDLKKAIKNGDFENLSEPEILEKIYESDSRLFKHDGSIMEAFNEIYKKHRPKPKIPVGRGLFIHEPEFASLDIHPEGIWHRIAQEGDLIRQLTIDAKTLILQFEQNNQDLKNFLDSTKHLKIIIFLLMIAFPITVLYPLHFMPVNLNENPVLIYDPLSILNASFSLKGLLLFLFFITIEGIFVYFILLLKRSRNALEENIASHTEEFLNLNSYSPHIKE